MYNNEDAGLYIDEMMTNICCPIINEIVQSCTLKLVEKRFMDKIPELIIK